MEDLLKISSLPFLYNKFEKWFTLVKNSTVKGEDFAQGQGSQY